MKLIGVGYYCRWVMLNPRCFFQFQLDDVTIAKPNDKGTRIQRVPHNASDQSISAILLHDGCISSHFVDLCDQTFQPHFIQHDHGHTISSPASSPLVTCHPSGENWVLSTRCSSSLRYTGFVESLGNGQVCKFAIDRVGLGRIKIC